MKFEPKSESEIAQDSLFPAGEYPFEVMAAADKISKAGNEMIELKITIYGNDGDTAKVFDYLMEKIAYKLRHFAEATGLLDEYEQGVLEAADCDGKTGYCKIVIDSSNPNYPPKNTVKDYIVQKQSAAPSKPTMMDAHKTSRLAQTPAEAGAFDDDIPF